MRPFQIPPMVVSIAACFLALAVRGTPANAQPKSTPRDGSTWVLLHNGEVLRGQLRRDGQRYRVELVEGGMAILPRREIWRVERCLQALYDFRAAEAERRGGPAHLDLAGWCLKHELLTEASVHLAIAKRAKIDAEQARDLRARIEVAISNRQRSALPRIAVQQVSAATDVSAPQETAEDTVHTTQLSPESLHQFSTRIQPLLINRCGNATCHGRASTSEFRLTRPQRRGLYTPRLTQRNAAAASAYLNYAAPSASRLLEWSVRPHGGMTSGGLNQQQLAILRQWLTTVTGKNVRQVQSAEASVSTGTGGGGLINPLTGAQKVAGANVADASMGDSSVDDRPANASDDPFDPELFNRQHHSVGDDG